MLAGIQFSPAIPDASVDCKAVAVGEPTGELRFYVIEAPRTSALIDRTTDQIARLAQDKAARGLFKADAAGYYTIEVRDITLSAPLPKFAGEVVAEHSDDDDSLWDESRLYAQYRRVRTAVGRYFWCTTAHVNQEPPNAGFWREDRLAWVTSTAYEVHDRVVFGDTVYQCLTAHTSSEPNAPPNDTYWRIVAVRTGIWVAEHIKRQIGESPVSATLDIRMVDDRVLTRIEDPYCVKLIPSNDSLAKVAAVASPILRILDVLRDNYTVNGLAIGLRGTQNGGSLSDRYFESIAKYNLHLGLATTSTVHNSADNTNTVTASDVVSLAGAVDRLNDIRTALLAHAASAVFHDASSTPYTVDALTDNKDLEAACLAAGVLWNSLGAHGTSNSAHGPSGDFASWEPKEAPYTLADLLTLTNATTAAYNTHRAKTSNGAPHAAADAENTLETGSLASAEGFIQTINAWADALEHHGYNKNADGSDATTAFHTKVDPVTKISFRASNVLTAFRLAESIERAYILHCLSTDVHVDGPGLGYFTPGAGTITGRLTKAWFDSTNRADQPIPERLNNGAVHLLRLGWTS